MKKLQFWWPIVVLVVIFAALFATNYHPGTYLLGWDTTSPELNLGLNFKRYVFAIWQEYRGLGSTDGQSYTANIVHWFYIAFLSLFLPQNLVRYTFTILTHLVGGIGLYVLLKTEVLPSVLKLQKKDPEEFQGRLSVIGLIGALLYQFNFMTIQMFYTPFETFSIHFAFLPWGIWALLKFFKNKDAKSLLLLAVVNILGVSQAQVPTVFIAYCLLLVWFFLSEFFTKNKAHLKSTISAAFILILVNSFWGIPYLYSGTTKSKDITESRQSRYSSMSVFYRNKAYGDLNSLALFGSFNLDYLSWNGEEKKVTSLMQGWEPYYNSTPHKVASYFVFSLSLIGVVIAVLYSVKNKTTYLLPFILSFVLFFSLLATNIPGFREFFSLLQNTIPLFANIFRTPFTKFSTVYVLLLSIFVSMSVFGFTSVNWFKQKKVFLTTPFFAAIFIAIGIFAQLSFKGLFFYPQLHVAVPKEYFVVSEYFNTADNNNRVLYLPIHSFWGWLTNSNNWGYLGSGFIWQMMPQPIHYRSFDSWSKENETAFLQFSHALYDFNPSLFKKLSEKYHTNEVFLEKNVSPLGTSTEQMYYDETNTLIANVPGSKLLKKEESLEVFSLENAQRNTAPYAPSAAVLVNTDYSTTYNVVDQAYEKYGAYIKNSEGITFPFNTLQKQEITAQPFSGQDKYALFPIELDTRSQLIFPLLSESYKAIPTSVYASASAKTIDVTLIPQLPELFDSSGKQLTKPKTINVQFTKPATSNVLLELESAFFTLELNKTTSNKQFLGMAAVPANKNFSLYIYQEVEIKNSQEKNYTKFDSDTLTTSPLTTKTDDEFKSFSKDLKKMTIAIPLGEANDYIVDVLGLLKDSKPPQLNCNPLNKGEVEKNVNDGVVQYTASKKGVTCDSVLPNLNVGFEYIYSITATTTNGEGIRQYLTNPLSRHTDLEIAIKEKDPQTWYTLYPSQNPLYPNSEEDFQLLTTVESFGNEKNTVQIKEMQFTSLPLTWLTGIRIEPTDIPFTERFDATINSYKKFGNFWYTIHTTVKSDKGLLVLPQSIDKGWVAISQKDGLTLLNKVEYNGWANAWYTPKGENYPVYVFFWPQFLVFGGYFLLFTTLGILVLQARVAHVQKRSNKQLRESKLLPIKQVLSKR